MDSIWNGRRPSVGRIEKKKTVLRCFWYKLAFRPTKDKMHANTLTAIINRMVISDVKAFLLTLGTWAEQACPVDSIVVAQLVVLCDIDATIIDPLQRAQTQWFQCIDSHHQKRVAPTGKKNVFRTVSLIYLRFCPPPLALHHHQKAIMKAVWAHQYDIEDKYQVHKCTIYHTKGLYLK